MTIRFAENFEYAGVLEFYKTCNYYGGVQDEDKILIAIDNRIIGAVRICTESGEKVLRGMQVKPAWQGKGIGSAMLKYLVEHVDMSDCYCLPYKHLKGFYALIGFKQLELQEAPIFLVERLGKYLSSGSEIIIMKIN